MSASASALLDEDVAQRVAHLRIRARRTVEGVRSGIHRSPHRGASVIFAEHRDYRPGDDLRLLDWRAYARNDRYTIKRFEQETHLRAHLLLDRSPSMRYGEGSLEKHAHACTLLAAMALILLGQGDAVGCYLIDAQVRDELPARNRPDHLDNLLELLSRPLDPEAPTHLERALTAAGERIGRRGLVVLASDLLDLTDTALEPLNHLAALGHDMIVFHVLHPDELELPFQHKARFFDPESEETLDADPAALRTAYRREISAFLDSCRRRCIAAGARYVLARTDVHAQQAVAAALTDRNRQPWG